MVKNSKELLGENCEFNDQFKSSHPKLFWFGISGLGWQFLLLFFQIMRGHRFFFGTR